MEAADGTGILCGLALGVVEVRGHRNDGVLDRFAKVSLSGLLHLCQNHGGDFLGEELLLRSKIFDLRV